MTQDQYSSVMYKLKLIIMSVTWKLISVNFIIYSWNIHYAYYVEDCGYKLIGIHDNNFLPKLLILNKLMIKCIVFISYVYFSFCRTLLGMHLTV